MIYDLADKYFMNDFTNQIAHILNNRKNQNKLKIFDIGCFVGNFSRNLKKKLKKEADFFLFDPNPNLKIVDFEYNKLAMSNKIGTKTFHLNTFFPSAGSGLNTIARDDWLWNITRKLITGGIGKKFSSFDVSTDTLDNFCLKNNLEEIDILKIDTEGSEMEVFEGGKNILKKTRIIQVEVLDTKKNFNIKYIKIKKFLEENYNFKKVIEKNIWSAGTLSNMKVVDLMFVKD